MAADYRALTVKYNGISNVLKSKASVGIAFDPTRSPAPSHYEFDGIWDTGATGSVISQDVVNRCALHPIGMTKVYTASGERTSNVYLVSIYLPNNVVFSAVRVTEGDIKGADILIGMDIIASGDLAITNYVMKTTFSYCIPSLAQLDFCGEADRLNRARNRAERRKTTRKKPKPKRQKKRR